MDQTQRKQAGETPEEVGAAHSPDLSGFSTFVWKPEDHPGSPQTKTIAHIMKELGLKSRTVKKYKATTNSKHNLPVAENVLNRQFLPGAPNKAWVTDIPKSPRKRGVEFSSVMDFYSRKIVGFQMAERMTKELVIQAPD